MHCSDANSGSAGPLSEHADESSDALSKELDLSLWY
jgi:hypothetical protein